MADTKDEKIERLINDIKENKLTKGEIKDIFEGYNFYMSKEEVTACIISLFLEVDNEIVKLIINSRKGKLYTNYQDEYGDSILNLLIIKAVRETDKRKSFNTLFELIEDDELIINWDMINNNHENTMHTVCLIANYLEPEELIRFMKLFKKHNFNPLNIDDIHRNSYDILLMDNKHSKTTTNKVIKMMEEMTSNFTVEVNNYVEDEVSVTVEAEG